MPRHELRRRIDALEEAYEFFLAFAAQGQLPGAGHDGELRRHLTNCQASLEGLASLFQIVASQGQDGEPPEFLAVLEEDASKAHAAISLVAGHKAIGSQLIDNLNASIHVRALLTDLFLLDEALLGADA